MKSIARNIIYSGAIRMKISRLQYTRNAKEKEKTKDKKNKRKKWYKNHSKSLLIKESQIQ